MSPRPRPATRPARRARAGPRAAAAPAARATAPAADRADAATYVYALLDQADEPTLRGAPLGLPGTGRPRLLPVDRGLWLVVADAPLSRYGQEKIERGLRDLEWVAACALGHERMVEHFVGQATVLPMKLFTLFRSDERAREHVASGRRRFSTLLRRVAGRREWGVRLSLDLARARTRARARATSEGRGLAEGTRFLMAKKREQAEVGRLEAVARQAADEVFQALSRTAHDARRREVAAAADSSSRLVLDAAFLVEETRTEAFQAAARRQAERLDPDGYRLAVTGPWPAYNFISDAG